METVRTLLEGCRLARSQTRRNLTVFLLLCPRILAPDYLVLEEALAGGSIEIRELGGEGSVPELRVVNTGARPVLIMEGEELAGAKQNRAVNVTILVAAGAELVIPVSCVEQGRWHYRSETFGSGDKLMHASLRRAAQASVCFSLAEGDGFRSDQGRVWDEVAEKAVRLKVDSPTMAAAEVFDRYEDQLEAFLDGFTLIERQTGALFAFLASAAGAKGRPHPSVGLGRTLTLGSRIVSGTALVYEDRVLHLSAFRKTNKPDTASRVGFQRFSRRRQRLH